MAFQIRLILIFMISVSTLSHAADRRNLNIHGGKGGNRVALVIGNGNYQHADILPKLDNPTHDAEDIAKALRGFGFEVIERKDQTLEGMNNSIAEFSRKIGNSDAALFYFAGHGLQVKGQNYLIPVNANIETEARVQYESVNMNLILDEMENAKSRVNIVMLDACRNNPISGKFRSVASRGLAVPSSQPKGTVIVYATDPGNVAADGNGRNGLFTAGLLTAFKGSDLSLAGVLTRASEEVERGSNKTQTPYVNGPMTLQRNFQFAQGTQVASFAPTPVAVSRMKSNAEIEQELWDSIRDAGSGEALNEYIKQYPRGRFVAQAKVLIAKLRTDSAPSKPEAVVPIKGANPEDSLWNVVSNSQDKDDLKAYMQQYPKGRYIALARTRIRKLEERAAQEAARQEQEALRQEQDAWDTAQTTNTEVAFRNYQKSYPQGRYAPLALLRVEKLRQEEESKPLPADWLRDDKKCRVHNPYPAVDSISWTGECLNGYAEGAGKLSRFENGKLVATIEGEFRSGKLNGHGLGTWPNGDRYDGDFRDGKRNGRGIFASSNGSRYEGDFTYDTTNGRGTLTFANGDRYEGEFRDGKRTGRGTYTWVNGNRYDGNFIDNQRTGQGTATSPNGFRYVGEYKEGRRSGRGTESSADGLRYEGEYRDDKWSGRGTLTLANGDRYEGEFKDGKRNGRGTYTWVNGNRYDGNWIDGQQTGQGNFNWANGARYEGEFRDGKKTGRGTLILVDGGRYVGEFRNDLPDGVGTFKTVSNSEYSGNFKEGCLDSFFNKAWILRTKEQCGF